MNIIILGPQGSGKGTQAKMLKEKFDLEYFEMGKILRDVAKEDSPLGKLIHETINIKGVLVDNDTFREVFFKKLGEISKEKGILFEGVPRNEYQLGFFKGESIEMDRKIDAVIVINLPEEDSIERLSKRWVCKENEHVLIMGKDIRKESEKCPICGSEIFQRVDDTPKRIKTRLGIYNKDTKPVIDYFRQKGILVEIDGRPSIGEVRQSILNKLKKLYE
ncbi:MAG: nucleoside monophosphate kinase [Candidatus Moranbacteria bacterium]|nr:nucleoside monophosphate kinase [Candidatus Moranbacteria bacterium]